MRAGRDDQFTATKVFERGLDGALRKPGLVGECSQTRGDKLPFAARSPAVKIQINKISRRLPVVAANIAHENIEDIIVDRDGLFEAGISERHVTGAE